LLLSFFWSRIDERQSKRESLGREMRSLSSRNPRQFEVFSETTLTYHIISLRYQSCLLLHSHPC
jgi:hypothetical protein